MFAQKSFDQDAPLEKHKAKQKRLKKPTPKPHAVRPVTFLQS